MSRHGRWARGTRPPYAQLVGPATAAARRVAAVTVVDNLLGLALPSHDYGDDAAPHSW
jgi:hypothetical protein